MEGATVYSKSDSLPLARYLDGGGGTRCVRLLSISFFVWLEGLVATDDQSDMMPLPRPPARLLCCCLCIVLLCMPASPGPPSTCSRSLERL